MLIVIGYLVVSVSVVGSFIALGGHLGALYQPFELTLIFGAAFGAFLAGNSKKSLMLVKKALPDALKSSQYSKEVYMELMALLYVLLNKARREGLMAIESHIEDPASSPIFSEYPRIMKDNKLMEFITDYLRIMISGNMSSFEIETLMDEEIETYRHEREIPTHALQQMADGLPAFGIVAAVLGVIKALAAVDQPPAILGDLISKAMVGTFLGILLAYGFVGPLASRVDRRTAEAVKVLECIKTTLLASMNGYPPQLAVEFGRKVLFSAVRPTLVSWKSTSGRPSPPARPDGAAGHEHRKQPPCGDPPQEGQGRRPPRRQLEDRLRRLHHGHDGVLPGDVADQHRAARRAGGHRGVLPHAAAGGADRRTQQLGRDQRRAWRWPRSAAQRWRRAPRPGQPVEAQPMVDAERRDHHRLENLKKRLENVIENSPVLKSFRPQLLIDMTTEGLRIQIIDNQNRPMFATGRAEVQPYMRDILRELGRS